MAGLKELRIRINSVKSTMKITSAMKMVAASRLRRAQILASQNVFYYDNLLSMTNRVIASVKRNCEEMETAFNLPSIMQAPSEVKGHLLVVISSDRGLCGGYNSAAAREAKRRAIELQKEGKIVKFLCIGKKSRDLLRKDFENDIIQTIEGVAHNGANYIEANTLNLSFPTIMAENNLDICEVIYTHFHSTMNRVPTVLTIYPLSIEETEENEDAINGDLYEYEPKAEKLLDELLQKLYYAKFYKTIVNSSASEHGARMTSMDSATRNAQDMIGKLTLRYNGIRQTAITTELIEIIAGAEAI